ncbi:YdaS family helix-turn-helix protein [Duganella sp. Leaf126]|uniref:transcriptional regulator n=1 Tax=Duganella sp. Leaf126 TaxID=1736266 RepID=UPI0009EA2C69|nr:YdaS family helix-turn-helix protein [Duganella sp. Leaf126]
MNLKTYSAQAEVKKAKLARSVGVSPALLHQWIEGIRPVAIRHCLAIERATEGQVTRQDLRPDDWQNIWPELAPSCAAAAPTDVTSLNRAGEPA